MGEAQSCLIGSRNSFRRPEGLIRRSAGPTTFQVTSSHMRPRHLSRSRSELAWSTSINAPPGPTAGHRSTSVWAARRITGSSPTATPARLRTGRSYKAAFMSTAKGSRIRRWRQKKTDSATHARPRRQTLNTFPPFPRLPGIRPALSMQSHRTDRVEKSDTPSERL